MPSPTLEQTAIPGLNVLRLPLLADSRGWFKENWHREAFSELGLSRFAPVQHNISFNSERGTTRGFHAEPWDKLVSVATGSVFAAWIDLREGPSFGATFSIEMSPDVTVFVPRGVANAFQTLSDGTAFSYLASAHWRPEAGYAAVNLADPQAAIPWPVPLQNAIVSSKDQNNPLLADTAPMPARRMLITGGNGQLGRALKEVFPLAQVAGRDVLDVTDASQVRNWPWSEVDVLLNAAAYTAVDDAETTKGRVSAWTGNAGAATHLAAAAREHGFTFVHFSTEYVFDGTKSPHAEDEPFSPLGVYGQTKAAADAIVAGVDHHYVLRPTWLIGAGRNFVRTMLELAESGASPRVVSDQIGRLTFAQDLAAAARHLLETKADFGTYNVTNSGPEMSWHDIARRIFTLAGRDPEDVTPVTTEEYVRGRRSAPRPLFSTLDLSKLEATGLEMQSADEALAAYVATLSSRP